MHATPAATADDRDLEHLRLLGILHYVFAGFALLGLVFLAGHYWFMSSMLDMATRHPSPNPPPESILGLMLGIYAVFGFICVLGAVLNVLAGHGLRNGRRWTLCFVVACLNCLQVPLGTVLGVFTLVVLNRTGVRARFAG